MIFIPAGVIKKSTMFSSKNKEEEEEVIQEQKTKDWKEIQELKNQINDKKSHNIHGKIDRYDQSSPLEAEPGTSHAEDEGRLWHQATHQRHAGHTGEILSV